MDRGRTRVLAVGAFVSAVMVVSRPVPAQTVGHGGVVVDKVAVGSEAERAGIRVGDVLCIPSE